MKEELKKIETGMVPVYETSTGEKVAYGTELHKALGAPSVYREWSKRRLNDVDAVENEDFGGVEISTPSGQTQKEHIIRLDTAKEMAMLERNEIGKQVRRYFIQVEKKYRTQMAELADSIKRFMLYQERRNEEFSKSNDRIAAMVAGRFSGKSRINCSRNGDNGIFQGSSLYDGMGGGSIEIRKKELYAITMKAADLFGESHSGILHQMYMALEQKLGIVLDAYKSVYRSETGRLDAGMVEVIAANDRLYEAAMDMNEYVIGKKQIYQ